MASSAIAAAVVVLLLLAVSWGRRSPVGTGGAGPWTLVLRSLLPAWRFFESVEAAPLLLYRRVDGDGVGPWIPVLRAPPRPWTALVFNPAGTFHLAAQGLVERLLEDLAAREGIELADAERLPSFALVRHLVGAVAVTEPGARYQLRLLTVQHAADRDTVEEEVFTSPCYRRDLEDEVGARDLEAGRRDLDDQGSADGGAR